MASMHGHRVIGIPFFLFMMMFFLQTAPRAELAVSPWQPSEPAGSAPDILEIGITGSVVQRDFFLPLAIDCVKKNIKLSSGAGYEISRRIVSPAFIRAGKTDTVLVRLKIFGNGYVTVEKAVVVLVKNFIPEDLSEAARIYVSNSPELLKETGILLSGTVSRHEAVRYLLHHKNGLGETLNLVLDLSNPGREPVRLLIMESELKTGVQEMVVGHRAAIEFIDNSREKIGYILEIPPGGYQAVSRTRLKPKEVISGIGEIHLIEGERLDFDIKAMEPYLYVASDDRNIGEYESQRGHGAYGRPYVDIHDEFVLGGRWKFIGIGETPLRSLRDGSTGLIGNYGVTYRVKVRVVNPTDKDEKVQMHFSPVSGPAHGTVIIDGEVITFGICRPPDTRKIVVFWIGPREEKWVNIEIMPESGSFYPVRIVFMSRKIS